ncbi:MAG: hypothetical protein ACRDCE_20460 [Cetobacterium sp.]|uniref:hypothetical protein n=1 Tax=Cetobacterium sp. TaxID=2071632 RepID=UPI003EE4C94E
MRITLTKEILRNSTMSNSSGSKRTIVEMIECINEGWSWELYSNYLSQFFTQDSIEQVAKPTWNSLV